MPLIDDETVLKVKNAADVVEVIQAYFPLKRAGSGFKAPCPFHDEKTPSFTVSPARQTWKCFGCGLGGDAIAFVRRYENADYPEAIEILAKRYGIEVRYKEGGDPRAPRKEALRKAMQWAAGLFRRVLNEAPQGEAARAFLGRRGVKEETAEQFRIGCAPAGWDFLLARAEKAGLSAEVLLAAGLAVPRDRGGAYDRFRNRVMFPIGDGWGDPVAFGARQLREEDVPKFLNSPETPLFSKARTFYGFHLSRDFFEAEKTAYIVEGYLDVVIPYQAGLRGFIATMGTALTREHLRHLRRHVEKVVLVFDSDAAGQKAAERGLDLLLSENLDLYVAQLPAGLDPDDVVVQKGPDALREAVSAPREIFSFLLDAAAARHASGTPAAKARVAEEMLGRLARIPDEIKRDVLLKDLAERFGLDPGRLRDRAARMTDQENASAKPAAPRPAAASTNKPLESAGRQALSAALSDPLVAITCWDEIPLSAFPEGPLRDVAAAAYDLIAKHEHLPSTDWLALMQDDAHASLAADILDSAVGPGPEAVRLYNAALEVFEADQNGRAVSALEDEARAAAPADRDAYLARVREERDKAPRRRGRLPGR